MKIPLIRLLLAALSMVALAGCGTSSETVNTVDDAVKLLQDIEQRGTWIAIEDGLGALADSGDYEALFILEGGDLVPGEPTTRETDNTVTIQVSVDAEGRARYEFAEAGRDPQHWLVIPAVDRSGDTEAAPEIYGEQDGVYRCAPDDMIALLQDGPQSIIDSVAATVAGIKTLSVIEEDGEVTRLDRDATRYMLEGQLDEALAILDQTSSEALRQQIEQAGTFTLAGTLDRDDDTGALLYYESIYQDTSRSTWASIIFEVTQWDDITTISIPDTLPVCN